MSLPEPTKNALIVASGIALILGGFWGCGSTIAFKSRAVSASGEVVEILRITRDNNSANSANPADPGAPQYGYAPVAEYKVGDRTYRTESHSYADADATPPKGAKVRILYDPRNPQNAMIAEPGWLWREAGWAPLLIGFGMMFVVAGLYGHRVRRRPRYPASGSPYAGYGFGLLWKTFGCLLGVILFFVFAYQAAHVFFSTRQRGTHENGRRTAEEQRMQTETKPRETNHADTTRR
jgi:hypothetical protein